jgi:hypothetical protein
VAAVACALAAVLLPAAASADVFCDYVDAGPEGPQGNILAVTAVGEETSFLDRVAAARRLDHEPEDTFDLFVRVTPQVDGRITVSQAEQLITCNGPQPSVSTVDTLRIVTSGDAYVLLDLAYAPLAPGSSDEGDGSSEIETQFSSEFGLLYVRGTPGPDRYVTRISGREEPRMTVNLNAQSDRDRDDPDITAQPPGLVAIFAGRGDDRLGNLAGADVVADEWFYSSYLFMLGGPGDDVIAAGTSRGDARGGRGDDTLRAGPVGTTLDGGPGEDVLTGSSSRDRLDGGDGRDRFEARGGRDSIAARDGIAETLDCGPGHDRIRNADDSDRRQRCEPPRERRRPRFPFPPPPPPE